MGFLRWIFDRVMSEEEPLAFVNCAAHPSTKVGIIDTPTTLRVQVF